MLSTAAIRRRGAASLAHAGGIILFAAFTALSARIVILLPFTPVPVTLQVLAVLLAGLMLGSRAGALSQIVYLAAIGAGLPLDARGLGPVALVGPTGGYLLGFVAAAFVTGWLAKRLAASRNRGGRLVAVLCGVAVVYACGLAWLAPAVGGLGAAWTLGAAPFVVGDLAKALLAAAAAESGKWLPPLRV